MCTEQFPFSCYFFFVFFVYRDVLIPTNEEANPGEPPASHCFLQVTSYSSPGPIVCYSTSEPITCYSTSELLTCTVFIFSLSNTSRTIRHGYAVKNNSRRRWRCRPRSFLNSYNVALAANFITGIISVVLGLFGPQLLRVIPPAALLVPVAGIGLAFLGLEQASAPFGAPLVGFMVRCETKNDGNS